MAKKKSKQASYPPINPILHSTHHVQVLRPWCWYCEREFEDEKGLLTHIYLSITVFIALIYTYFSFNAASKSQTL